MKTCPMDGAKSNPRERSDVVMSTLGSVPGSGVMAGTAGSKPSFSPEVLRDFDRPGVIRKLSICLFEPYSLRAD